MYHKWILLFSNPANPEADSQGFTCAWWEEVVAEGWVRYKPSELDSGTPSLHVFYFKLSLMMGFCLPTFHLRKLRFGNMKWSSQIRELMSSGAGIQTEAIWFQIYFCFTYTVMHWQMFNNQLSGKKEPSIVAFADFRGVNVPMADDKLPKDVTEHRTVLWAAALAPTTRCPNQM